MTGFRKFHKIKYLKTAESANYSVTVTQPLAETFSGCIFFEQQTEQGIFLLKSGGDMFEQKEITVVINKPCLHVREKIKYFERI